VNADPTADPEPTTEEQDPDMPKNAEITDQNTDTAAPADSDAAAEVAAAAAPDAIDTVRARDRQPAALTASRVIETLAAVRAGERSPEITAALVDITRSANPNISPDQWLGEIWTGNAASREIIPKFTTATLTGLKAKGWKWTTKPKVAKYSGDK